MVPNPSSATVASHSRLSRPRRSSTSALVRDSESQKIASDSLAVLKKQKEIQEAVVTIRGVPASRIPKTKRRSGDIEPSDRRFDTAHCPRPKQYSAVEQRQNGPADQQPRNAAPRRRPSFGSLLGTNASQPQVRSEADLSKMRRLDSDQSTISPDVGVPIDAGVFLEAGVFPETGVVPLESGDSVNSISDDGGKQHVDPDMSGFCSQSDSQSLTQEMEVGLDAEDWLSLHATDLIRRIQAWSDALATREMQLNARISLQEQRERKYRALCQSPAS